MYSVKSQASAIVGDQCGTARKENDGGIDGWALWPRRRCRGLCDPPLVAIRDGDVETWMVKLHRYASDVSTREPELEGNETQRHYETDDLRESPNRHTLTSTN